MRARVLALLLGLALSAALLELAARVLWTPPWYEHLVAEQRRAQEYPYLLNAWGLRDRDYATPRPPGRARLLMLGDSFTFGQGVLDDRQVFPEILERELDRRRPPLAPDGVEVLNGGLGGTLPGAWLKLWRRIGDDFDPDAVLVVFFLRDGTPVVSKRDFFQLIRDDVARRNRDSHAYRAFYTLRLIRDRIDGWRISHHYTSLFHDSYFGDEAQTAVWRRVQRQLLRLRDLVEASGARFGFAVFPILVELDEDYPFREIQERLLAFGVENGFRVHDLLPAFLGEHGPDLWVSPADQHPNALAHAIAAESLLPFAASLLDRKRP